MAFTEEIAYPLSVQRAGVLVYMSDASNRVIVCGREVSPERIAACLNACRDISTEDLELCGEDAFNRNWNLRRLAQDAMFNSGNAAKVE